MKYLIAVCMVFTLLAFSGCPGPKEHTTEPQPTQPERSMKDEMTASVTGTLERLGARLEKARATHPDASDDLDKAEQLLKETEAQIARIKDIEKDEDVPYKLPEINSKFYAVEKILSSLGE